MEYLPEVISALTGAGAGALIHAIVRRRDLDQYAARIITDELFELRQKENLLERYNAEHVKTIAEQKEELYTIKMQNEILRAFPFHIPLPMWSIDWRHHYDYVNQIYIDIFLSHLGITKPEQVIGKSLYEIWPDETAGQFVANNKKVMDEDLIMNDTEDVPDRTGQLSKWRILKFKRPYPNGLIGFAIPVNGFFDKHLKKVKPD